MTRRALVIGINRYPFWSNCLTTAARDAEKIACFLDGAPSGFSWDVWRMPESFTPEGKPQVEEKKITLSQAELSNAIHELLYRKPLPEVALLFFAGHGIRREWEGKRDGFLAASDTEVEAQTEDEVGISFSWLRGELLNSPVKKQIVWLDCCHSGELLSFTEAELEQLHLRGDRCLIAACQGDRVAYAASAGGVLTQELVKALNPELHPEEPWINTGRVTDLIEARRQKEPLLKRQIPICKNFGERIDLWPGRGKNLSPSIQDWQSLCHQRLEQQHAISSNFLTGIAAKIEDVYVPLGLVERKEKSRKKEGDESDAARGSALYAETGITRSFQHDEFLENVLRRGDSPKSKGKRLVILGEPGAGKTTLLQQASRWVAAEIDDAVVLWVSMADSDLAGRNLDDYLLEIWLRDTVRMAGKASVTETDKNDLIGQFHQGRVWLFLDGADEMAASNPLLEINKQIRNSGLLDKARILLTCRLNLWDGGSNPLAEFDVYRTLNFDYPVQVEQFINSWFTTLGKTDALAIARGQQLCTALKEAGKEQIQDLVKNPLRLTLLCFTWKEREGKLPDTKAGLYEKFVEQFYEWKENQFPLSDEKQQELNKALGELAREAIDKESTRFRLRHKFVSKFLGSLKDKSSLFDLALKVGWLNQVGVDANNPDEPVYAFYHASFQEYFAALAVESWDYFLPRNHVNFPVDGKKYRIFEPQWKQVILLWLGREDIVNEEKEKFIDKLVNFEDGCGEWNFEKVDRGLYHYRAYFLAAAGIGEFKTYSLADAIVHQIVQWVFTSFNEEEQEWQTYLQLVAEETLFQTDRKRAIEELCRILKYPHLPEHIRIKAADFLGLFSPLHPQAIAEWVRIIEITDDKYLLQNVVYTLEEIAPSHPQVITGLVKIIKITENKYGLNDILHAVDTLEKIAPGHPQVIAGLVKVLATTDEFRDDIKNKLYKMIRNPTRFIATLTKILETTSNLDTRLNTATILVEIDPGNLQAIAELSKIIETSNASY